MNILMIDELPLYIHGMKVELKRIMPEYTVIDANNYEQAIGLLSSSIFSLILLDGDMECTQFIPMLNREYPRIPVVVMLRKATGKMFNYYLRQNIKGVLTKDQSVEKISQILKMVHAGIVCFPEQIVLTADTEAASGNTVSRLSQRQQEVLKLLAKGGTNKQIGRQLNISAGTVKVHLESIFNRLQVNNRTQAARLYFRYVTNHVISE